jgi:hypothetical protein
VDDASSVSLVELLQLILPGHESNGREPVGGPVRGDTATCLSATLGLGAVVPFMYVVFALGGAVGSSDQRNMVGNCVTFRLNWWKSGFHAAPCTSVILSRCPLKGLSSDR